MSATSKWTFGRGIRRAIVHSVAWGIPCSAALSALMWIGAPWLNRLVTPIVAGYYAARWTFMGVLIASAAVTVPLAWLLWARLKLAAGFTGTLLG